MTFSVLGAAVTLLVISVFTKHNHTPIVKAAGREVSYVLLSGLLLCYLITFVLILKPTDIVCAVQRYEYSCTVNDPIKRIFSKNFFEKPEIRRRKTICSVFPNALWNVGWPFDDIVVHHIKFNVHYRV